MTQNTSSINVNFDELAFELLRRLSGDEHVSTDLQPLLSGAFTDVFAFGSKIARSVDWIGTMFGAADKSDLANAFRIGEVLSGVIPTELRSRLTRALSDDKSVTSDSTVASTRQAEPAPKDVMKDLLQRLKNLGGPGASSATQAVTLLNEFHDELWKMVGTMAPPTGSKWSPENVLRSVRELILKWIGALSALNLPGPNTKAIAVEIEAEAVGPFQERLFVAGVLSTGGFALYGVDDLRVLLRPASSSQIGIEVHQVLQEEYRRSRIANVIVQESIVYFAGTATPIAKRAAADINIQALYLSRDRYLLRMRQLLKGKRILIAKEIEAGLRDDNLDLTVAADWEIKPIRGAALGVAQEFAYRTFFNFYTALLKDLPALASPQIGTLPRFWKTCDHLYGGIYSQWGEVMNNPVRVIDRDLDKPQTVLLVIVDTLPGLLLYLRFDLPASVVAALANDIVRVLNWKAKQLKKGFRTAVAVLVYVMVIAVMIVVVVALILAIIDGAAEIAAILADAAATLGPALALIGTKLSEIVDVLRRIAEQIGPLKSSYGLNVKGLNSTAAGCINLRFSVKDGTPTDSVPCASATFGMLRLENAPIQLIVGLPGIFAAGTALASAMLLSRLGPNVA